MKRKLSILILLALLAAVLVLPAQATELGHVTDAAGLLTDQEWQELEAFCGSTSDRYQCGIYIITVEDYRDYGSGDVFEVTYGIYHQYALGAGTDRNGVILLLSMEDRDFALFVYGDGAENAFNGYGQQLLEEAFLPEFGENDWYGGFRAYADTCARFLGQAAMGKPVRESPVLPIALLIGGSFLVSLIVVTILKRGMKNVQKQTQANAYVSGGLNLTGQRDQFTHTTETRRKIETDSGSSGSSARSGGGGSGRSGKF